MKKAVISFVILFYVIGLGFVNIEAKTKTIGQVSVPDTKITNENEEEYFSKAEIEKLLKENSDAYEKKLLQSKLDMQLEKNKILEGNITTILTLLGIIIAIIAALFAFAGKWLQKKIQFDIDSKLTNMEELKKSVENVNTDFNNRYKEVIDTYRKLKDLEDDIHKTNVNYRNFLEEKEIMNKSIDAILNYCKYLEYRCVESEWIIKFIAESTRRNKVITELKELIDTQLTENVENIALTKFFRKYNSNITEDDSKLINIYNYYVNCVEREKNYFIEKIRIFEKYQFTEDDDYYSEMEGSYYDWEGYMEVLEDMYNIVKASIAMN